jgi:hypothetical protein
MHYCTVAVPRKIKQSVWEHVTYIRTSDHRHPVNF